jgi:hypothetical protein
LNQEENDFFKIVMLSLVLIGLITTIARVARKGKTPACELSNQINEPMDSVTFSLFIGDVVEECDNR